MGVDYSGHYGIGVQVEIKKDLDCSFQEWLEDNLNEDYDYFETGQAAYTGGYNDFYIYIVDINCALYNTEEQKDLLFKELDRLGVDACGEFGVIGGLEIH